MRKLINVLFVAAGLMFTANAANAQQKLGHIISNEIYATMPEYKTAQTALEAFYKVKKDDMDKMAGEYDAKVAAAQKKQSEISDANREAYTKDLQQVQKELVDLQGRIQAAEKKAQTDVQAKEGELFQPVMQKISAAMNAVAKEKGLAYVFDLTAQGANTLVYFDGGEDITPAVKTKLGIAATAKPATTPVKKP